MDSYGFRPLYHIRFKGIINQSVNQKFIIIYNYIQFWKALWAYSAKYTWIYKINYNMF